MDDTDHGPRSHARRAFLAAGGAALGLLITGCSSDGGDDEGAGAGRDKPAGTASTTAPTGDDSSDGGEDLSAGTPPSTVLTAADFAGLAACQLSTPMTAGPFPSRTLIERRDVTEGIDGHPLRLGLQVLDEACDPVPGAVVELWHCDTTGDYSAYLDGGTDDDAGEGTTFLRGSQVANDDGIVEFHTVYPGWYSGRAVHIHLGVHIGESNPLTTQLFFADELNDRVFADAPYAAHGEPDTTNEQDGIGTGDPEAIGALATASDDADIEGTRALLLLTIPATTNDA